MKIQQFNTETFQPGSIAAAPDHLRKDADARVDSLLWFNGENADNRSSKPAETGVQLSAWENYIIAIAG